VYASRVRTLRFLAIACLSLAWSCGSPSEPLAEAELATPEPASVASHVRGRLLGHDGQPLALAQVHATRIGQPSMIIPVARDGSFTLDLPGPEWVTARLTGVDHHEHTIRFLAASGEHQLAVQLGTYERPTAIESVVGFGQFDGQGERVDLSFTRRDDGLWIAKVARSEADRAAKEFHYQLSNATSVGRTINGSQADRHVYDGGGDYFSVVTLDGDDGFELVFDPAALPPAGLDHQLSSADPTSLVASTAMMDETIAAWREETREAIRNARRTIDDPEAAVEQAYAELGERCMQAAEAQRDPVLQSMLFVGWAWTLGLEPSPDERAKRAAPAKRVLQSLGPRDPVWTLEPGAMANVLAHVDDPQYFAIAAAEHPDPNVSAGLWIAALIVADHAGELARAQEAMTALADPRFAEVPGIAVTRMYDPGRPTAPGRMIPDFRLRSADGKTEYSAADLRGKIYVLDFWATWCEPCVAELPHLHSAYAALNGQAPVEGREYRAVADPKLELISISFDHDTAVVEKFRKEHWPMPWAHVVPDVVTHKQLNELFGIAGIPTMVLVGPDGTILASSPRLDGENLGEIAAPFLQ
jgi:thiol-disulfide isomerase/thioredoxin